MCFAPQSLKPGCGPTSKSNTKKQNNNLFAIILLNCKDSTVVLGASESTFAYLFLVVGDATQIHVYKKKKMS